MGGGDWSRAWNVGRTVASVLRPLPSANVRQRFFQTLSLKCAGIFFSASLLITFLVLVLLRRNGSRKNQFCYF